jgi:hypothetical protein
MLSAINKENRVRRIAKWTGIAVAGVLLIAQFIRPPRNSAGADGPSDIGSRFHPPQEVANILRVSCYDCHSDATRYPWYAEVQPVGWWLNSHITDGKRQVNFTEIGSYRIRRQYGKLGEMAEQIEQGKMPLPSYLLIHTDAKLSPEGKEMLLSWIRATRDSMKAAYPPDSLERRR